ncbi:MAG: transposase [Clostridium sp.]|nr:transposase [Clostridium sp.]
MNKKENNPQIACGLFLWATGYFVDTVGKNEKIIKEYIRNQLQEDYIADQIEIKEYIDPFKKENK